MSEIKLNRRYPESRLEDVTDAYTRGFEFGRAMRTRATDQSEIEQSIVDLWAAVSDLKVWVDAHKNGITQEDFYARQFVYWAVNKEPLERLDVLERRIKRIERLLEPTSLQMTKIITLITRFARITGRTNKEVADALLATKTLKSLGQTGDGLMTYEQANAAISILESWIRRKREHQFS